MKISFITQPEYFRFIYEKDLENQAQVYEHTFNFGMDVSAYQGLLDFDADYNFFFRGEFIPESILQQLSGLKICLSSEPFPRITHGHLEYTKDSIYRYETFRSIRTKTYDYVFHYDAASLEVLHKDGLHLSGSFPFPVATGSYYPLNAKKKWDLFFIGRSTDRREQFFSILKHLYHFLHISHGVWGPELNTYMNQSKICLNIHAENEISWEPRLQMTLATGAFVISEKISKNEILRPGIDYVEANSPQQLHELTTYYLDHDDERKTIANSGYNRILDMLDTSKKIPELISQINSGAIPLYSVSTGHVMMNVISAAINQYRRFKR